MKNKERQSFVGLTPNVTGLNPNVTHLLFFSLRLIHVLGGAGRVLDAVVLEGEDARSRSVLAKDGEGIVTGFSSEFHSICNRNQIVEQGYQTFGPHYF
jgi:hypothetical protein